VYVGTSQDHNVRLCVLFKFYVPSTKLEIRAEQFLPERKGVWGRGRNDPNIVCPYE
jgi:hypothetical protein